MSAPKVKSGFTLIETLVALVLSSVLVAAAFKAYIAMNNVSLTQQDISEMQSIGRNCLDEISRAARSAGYKLAGYAPYKINGDSLLVFSSQTKPVDTTVYFLQEFTDTEYAQVVGRPKDLTFYSLYKQVNSGPASAFASHIAGMDYIVVDSATMAVSVIVLAPRQDKTFAQNNGFRTLPCAQLVYVRNAAL